jgi:hypothetical protein
LSATPDTTADLAADTLSLEPVARNDLDEVRNWLIREAA